MNENVEIRTDRATGNSRRIDFTHEFEPAKTSVEIADIPSQKRGFGGFCFRFAPVDRGTASTVIRTDKRVLPKDGIMEVAK
jgi:hypothetical protein